jgi:hypothetical protein
MHKHKLDLAEGDDNPGWKISVASTHFNTNHNWLVVLIILKNMSSSMGLELWKKHV